MKRALLVRNCAGDSRLSSSWAGIWKAIWTASRCMGTGYLLPDQLFSQLLTNGDKTLYRQHVFIDSDRFSKIIRPASGLCIFVQSILGLYELASLQRPFDASNQLALVWQIVEHQPAALPPETPNDIVDIIRGLLQKDPCETECFRSFRCLWTCVWRPTEMVETSHV